MPERKLARGQGARRALFRSLVTSLLEHEKIVTTHARGEEISAIAEKLITLAKEDNLNNRRQAFAYVLKPDVVRKLFDTLAPRYQDRPGGYTRSLKIGRRRGDAAPMVQLELL